MTIIRNARLSLLVPGIFLALVLVGLFRVTEVVAEQVLAMLGSERPGLPPLIGWLAVAGAGSLGAAYFWRMKKWGERSYEYTPSTGERSTDEERGQLKAQARLIESADDSPPLDRVVAVGQTLRVGNVTMELIAIELRQEVGRLTMVIRDPEGKAEEKRRLERLSMMSRPDPDDFPTPLRPVMHVADDVGTTYIAWSPGGGGDAGSYRWDFLFGPKIPETARALTIVVERLTDAPEFRYPGQRGKPRVIPGPWRYDVPLHAGYVGPG